MTPSALVHAHLSLVRAIAVQVKRESPFADIDDLRGWGTVGLIEASLRFREGGEAQFVTFAWKRIRGAMVDGIRKSTLGPARGARWKVEGLNSIRGLIADEESLEEALDRAREIRLVREAIAQLPEKERVLVEAVDLDGRGIPEAGEAMGVSRTWAWKLRTRGTAALREQFS